MAHWYDRYLKGNRKSASSFWSDEFDYDSDSVKSVMTESEIDTLKKFRLSSARKAIGNFVSIATGKNIPVRFSIGKESYTDGKSVVISGDIDDTEKFDIGVGLALHEGSHILLTDFNVLPNLQTYITKEIEDKGKRVGIYTPYTYIRNILNVVEDRRIDQYIYTNAPGYREYYKKLYDHYFGSKVISEALTSDEWNEETAENYMNRLINIINPDTSLTALKGMRKIWDTLNISNISRLKSTTDSLQVSLEIFNIICESLQPKPFEKEGEEGQPQPQNGDGEGQDGQDNQDGGDSGEESSDGNGESPEDTDGDGEEESRGGSAQSAAGNGAKSGKEKESDKEGKPSDKLSDAKRRKLDKAMRDAKDFLNGQTKKKKITNKMNQEIQAVENDGSELAHAGNDITDGYKNNGKGVDVIVQKNLTVDMLKRSHPLARLRYNSTTKTQELVPVMESSVFSDAERMGIMLGKKLQVMNDSRSTVYNRQRHGKIDRRLVHSLGFDAESVFTQLHVDKYRKANIHLSIDASSSMAGSKWNKTMFTTVALAKAVSMIPNLSMQVSFRFSMDIAPYLVFAWDSRKDHYKKVQQIFPYLRSNGCTPEGLCFEVMDKLIVPSTNDMDSYFINICDGEPAYSNNTMNYVGRVAWEHTKKQVEKFRREGIKVLSYYVSETDNIPSEHSHCYTAFNTMYGKDARFINIKNVVEVANTMNRLFLNK